MAVEHARSHRTGYFDAMGKRHGGWLERLGLGRPELRAWALYDWGNSGFVTTILAAVFPIYFAEVAAGDLPRVEATVRFSAATTLALAISAVLSPLLGAMADRRGERVPLLRASTLIAVAATAALALVGRGDWKLAAVLFAVANIALSASFVFYDSLLPAIADEREVDRVSGAGYALGYLGGGILLALNLAWITNPTTFGLADSEAAARLSFLSAALWWAAFAIPLLRRRNLGATALPARPLGSVVPAVLATLAGTVRELRKHRPAFLMLIAFLIYSDGIGTVIRMATIYGAEIGIGRGSMITALLVTQVVGVPFTFLFGALGERLGAKRAIFLGLGAYCAITVLVFFMRTPAHFFALAFLVGTVQGGTQALSRSLFSSLIPRNRSGEFFGFFSIADKFAGILGPAVFAATAALTGTSRSAVAAVAIFFVLGGAILAFVDVDAGRRSVRGGNLIG